MSKDFDYTTNQHLFSSIPFFNLSKANSYSMVLGLGAISLYQVSEDFMLYPGMTLIDSELLRAHCLATQDLDVLHFCFLLSVTWSDFCGTLPAMNGSQGHFFHRLSPCDIAHFV